MRPRSKQASVRPLLCEGFRRFRGVLGLGIRSSRQRGDMLNQESSNGHQPKRAVLYARVSTEEQAKSGYSLAQQMEALLQYATREGYEVLEEVNDLGQSGTSLARPGMNRV